ncbi:zinc ribbon domain-containing protein [Halorubrum rubrum]|uniref:Zinc ribbon domain-containing protein n=1 Tax=Halorubrum rubrum TaxID=1126240 RepID=A0ABD5R1H8_9EURY|nr:zinc ribbon domain-containing protein [Halorubrum rubrum]
MSEIRRRRPWLAVLLALLISGLGHAYLRRWARAFGWYVVITATLVLLVPDAAVDRLLAREAPPLADIAPGLLAVLASVVDAYVLAVRNNRRYDRQRGAGGERTVETGGKTGAGRTGAGETGTGTVERAGADGTVTDESDAGSAGPEGERRARRTGTDAEGKPPGAVPSTIKCPNCGRKTDADLDFCHWCTEPLDAPDGPAE